LERPLRAVRRDRSPRTHVVALTLALLTVASMLTILAGSATQADAVPRARHGKPHTKPTKPRTVDACGRRLGRPGGGRWRCSFVDNFDEDALDTSKWLVGETAWSGFRMGSTCFTADNVALDSGDLLLTARDTGQDFSCSSPAGAFTTRYTGAHLGTVGHWAQTLGRFEVRSRYPATGAGTHGGFWLYPALPGAYGAWPLSGEIDVAEWWSQVPRSVLPTLHYAGSGNADTGWGCQVDDPTQWHTYTLIWLRTRMRFLIDGRRCFSRSWRPDSPSIAPQPFDKPFNMILNMAVGDTAGFNAVTSATTLPATYVVDYVKAWR
jgi:beta-glucanase (GH16 family)